MSDSGVSRITPRLRQLEAPEELRRLQGWGFWKVEYEGEKRRKIFYWANGQKRFGRNGSTTDRARLTTCEKAKEAAAKHGADGLALALMPEWGVTALDFDNCVGPEGELPPEIADIVAETYAEVSPSGKGVRAFFKGDVSNHKSPSSHADGWGFETFSSTGWVTFTGDALWTTDMFGRENTVAPVGERVLALCDRRFGKDRAASSPRDEEEDPFAGIAPKLDIPMPQAVELLSDLDPYMPRDAWIRVAMALWHEYDGDYEAFQAWDEWSSQAVGYPGTENLQQQWDSISRRVQTRGRPTTMATVLAMSKAARKAQGLEARVQESEALERALEEAEEALKNPDLERWATTDDFDGKYKIVTAGSYARRDPPEWIIKNVLPQADVGVIYGDSGAGKSFIALDLAAHVAQGIPWQGNRVKPGRVLYVAAEGQGGVVLRLQAYASHHLLDLDDIPVAILADLPNFLDSDDVGEVVKAITNAGGFDLVILDTWAQVISGADENSGQDISKALKNVRKIRKAVGCMTLLVHHSGKDASKGARGWSGLRAAADCQLEVLRYEGEQTRVLRTAKQKDGDDTLKWGFNLEKVGLGADKDGDPLVSLVVEYCEAPDIDEMADRAKNNTKKDELGESILAAVNSLFSQDPARHLVETDEFVETVFTNYTFDRTEAVEAELRKRLVAGTPKAALRHGSVEIKQF